MSTVTHQRPATTDEVAQAFEDHHVRVYRAAYRVTGSHEDAEDVLQSVFARLLRRPELVARCDPEGRYLCRAAINGALDIVRRRPDDTPLSIDELQPARHLASDARPERAADAAALRARLRHALARLGTMTAEAFALRYLEGYTNREIATLLGTSPSSVGVLLHRARARLETDLRQWTGEDT